MAPLLFWRVICGVFRALFSCGRKTPDLSADVCLVTGAGQGLGGQFALQLAECGAALVRAWDSCITEASDHCSTAIAAQIAVNVSWVRLWDMALDLVSRASRIFRWEERAGKNTSGHSDQLSVPRRNLIITFNGRRSRPWNVN